jgi:hypothetical protein
MDTKDQADQLIGYIKASPLNGDTGNFVITLIERIATSTEMHDAHKRLQLRYVRELVANAVENLYRQM